MRGDDDTAWVCESHPDCPRKDAVKGLMPAIATPGCRASHAIRVTPITAPDITCTARIINAPRHNRSKDASKMLEADHAAYPAWKIEAAKMLQRRQDIAATAIPERVWANLHARASTHRPRPTVPRSTSGAFDRPGRYGERQRGKRGQQTWAGQKSRRCRCIAACIAYIFSVNRRTRGNSMAWTTPTLVEICSGLEINGYLPAEF